MKFHINGESFVRFTDVTDVLDLENPTKLFKSDFTRDYEKKIKGQMSNEFDFNQLKHHSLTENEFMKQTIEEMIKP